MSTMKLISRLWMYFQCHFLHLTDFQLVNKLKQKELEIDEIKRTFRYTEFDYKQKIQEVN